MPTLPINSVMKALNILEMLTEDISGRGVALSEIASRLNQKVTTTHNILKTLQKCGYVEKVGAGRYRLGWRFFSLMRRERFDLDPKGVVIRKIKDFADRIGELVVLTSLFAGRRCVLIRIDSNKIVRVDPSVVDVSDRTVNIWKVVTGRVLAAFCSPQELEQIINNWGLPADNWDGITTRQDLDRKLEMVRGEGFAEHIKEEVVSLAAPVLDKSGFLLGAVGVVVPRYRYEENRKMIIQELTNLCSFLGARL